MKLRTILFPTDFSHTGDAALQFATSLARDTGARLLIVHVEEPPIAYGTGEMYYGMAEPNADQLMAMLKKVVPSDATVPFEHRLITDDPAGGLVSLAEENNVD
ncbi:MAG: universal stress protein, partial [Planctomycetales bacterium]|nr:universal stress protein [Planctomycetales bacterium]